MLILQAQKKKFKDCYNQSPSSLSKQEYQVNQYKNKSSLHFYQQNYPTKTYQFTSSKNRNKKHFPQNITRNYNVIDKHILMNL